METIGRAKTQQGGVWLAVYGLRELMDNLADAAEDDTEERDNLRLAHKALCRALDEVEEAGYRLGCVPGEPE